MMIAAIFNAGDDSDLVRLMAKLAAVKNFLASDDGSICSTPIVAPPIS